MLQILKNRLKAKMPSNSNHASDTSKPSSTFTVPGMYLFHKYNEFKRQQQELHRKKVTEKELEHLNQKIDRLLSKIDDRDFELTPGEDDEECVICMNAKATMETHPCGHRVICRKCFIKTIQVAVSQRCLPLKCVICRTRILKLRQPAYIKVSSSTLQKLRSSEGHSKSPKPSRIYAK